MNFLTSEYIALLKEDGELDALLIDILISRGITPISKPQKGRQYGVDIAAIGNDTDGIKKIFLITVKQGNIRRSVWDTGPNSVRQSLNDIRETFINISLTSSQKKLPKKIILATNGELEQTTQVSWAQYTETYKANNLEYQFWGIDDISKMVSDNLLSERLFNSEMRLLLKRTLAFLELKDYDLNHFKKLVDLILDKPIKTKKPLLKRLKLLQICLNIVFKWAEDNGYIKSAIYAADKTILKTFEWLNEQGHFKEKYVHLEFYEIHILRRRIGIAYFKKVSGHYYIEHSLQRYSRNQIEYSLTVWEEIGILANIGLTEIKHYQYHYDSKAPDAASIYHEAAITIAEALIELINKNPPSHYPLYDDHIIDIAPAFQFLYSIGFKEQCVKWLRTLVVGIHDSQLLKDFFPLFRANYENLVDYYVGTKKQDEKSSMLLTLLADWSAILNSTEAYSDLKKIVELFKNKLNLQIWFPKPETENFYLSNDYSRKSGKVKHSINLYDSLDDYKKEIEDEIKLFTVEKDFSAVKIGYDLIFTITSGYHRELPFPIFWRRFIK
ncbi:hypothetical protein GCM10011344_26800 [Dokdonia pacifica]|uniref:Restriction endonuclease n=1 Tax=Dokdonia pacifica TaxID=1627892 RepID=A0A239DZJ3_9FLAO|nr:hypothetical protein [Dokdonia pacifica]GGG24754.1 hypothetical protein GCM10011344_26800 [Dokdonia pacifica]SNS37689.1 hypothetical protein SAMN06265376_11316 [Dokdonia pacifica]